MATIHLPVSAWRAHAARAIMAFVTARGGAVVWVEVEAALARSNWYAANVGGAPPLPRIDPHHLTYARRVLLKTGDLVEQTAILNGRPVTAYIDGRATDRRDATRTDRLAASKRRTYRRFLSWTGNPSLCGGILERQVHATLDERRGFDLLLVEASPGHVATIGGRAVPGGPLDHAGSLIVAPDATNPDLVGFVVEDKNLRGALYPRHHEVWDLLVKAAAFPERVPILITAHVHYTLLTFFKAIGAVVYTSGRQSFAPPPQIPSDDFNKVTRSLGLRDARQLLYPDQPSAAIRGSSPPLCARCRQPSRNL